LIEPATLASLSRRHTLIAGVATVAHAVLSPTRASAKEKTEQVDAAPTVTATPTEEVPYVQTPMHVVRRMLQLAEVRARDEVWDLGSGDGRIVIEAAKLGARAIGYEIDPNLIRESVRNARRARVAGRTSFVERDLFTLDFKTPSVVTMYLLPEFNLKLRPRMLEQMKPGSRIVSHEWDMGDWQADETLIYPSPAKPHGTSKEHKVYLWIVPASVRGRWRVEIDGRPPFDMQVDQTYQQVQFRSEEVSIAWAALRGRSLRFALRTGARATEFAGEVSADGKAIRAATWRATKLHSS
jgi:SAM-dependent methyltransferase